MKKFNSYLTKTSTTTFSPGFFSNVLLLHVSTCGTQFFLSGVCIYVHVCIHTYCIYTYTWAYNKYLNMQTCLHSLKYQHYCFARQSITELPITLINMVVVHSLAVHFSIPSSFSLPSPIWFSFSCVPVQTHILLHTFCLLQTFLSFFSFLIPLHFSY